MSNQEISVKISSVQTTVEAIHQVLPVHSNEIASFESGINRVEDVVRRMDRRFQDIQPSMAILPSLQAEMLERFSALV